MLTRPPVVGQARVRASGSASYELQRELPIRVRVQGRSNTRGAEIGELGERFRTQHPLAQPPPPPRGGDVTTGGAGFVVARQLDKPRTASGRQFATIEDPGRRMMKNGITLQTQCVQTFSDLTQAGTCSFAEAIVHPGSRGEGAPCCAGPAQFRRRGGGFRTRPSDFHRWRSSGCRSRTRGGPSPEVRAGCTGWTQLHTGWLSSAPATAPALNTAGVGVPHLAGGQQDGDQLACEQLNVGMYRPADADIGDLVGASAVLV